MISQICSATSRAGIKHTINSNQMLSCTSIIIGIDLGCYVSVIVGHGDTVSVAGLVARGQVHVLKL